MDLDGLGASILEQGQHFTAQVLHCGDAAIQTLARDHRELTLNHVQPTGALGRVVELKALRKRECLLGTQMLVKRTRVMGVEVVEHQPDLGRIRVHRRKPLTKLAELALGSSLMHLSEPASCQRLDRRQQHTRAQFLILVVLLSNLAFAHGAWQQGITNQETRSLIEADHWRARIVGLGIQPQDMFKLCQKRGINLAQAPGLFQIGLEFVFFKTSRTKVYETSSQMPLSTAFSASRRRLQRA